MTYTLTVNPNVIVRDEDGVRLIPTDQANIDYQATTRGSTRATSRRPTRRRQRPRRPPGDNINR